mmetsp:Transcript_18941/g.36146  ORF Transcript_18941/g.36146 Transcript_18941/m.36146 type:complete len:283 (-) Transcript_18941:598-1446(-)
MLRFFSQHGQHHLNKIHVQFSPIWSPHGLLRFEAYMLPSDAFNRSAVDQGHASDQFVDQGAHRPYIALLGVWLVPQHLRRHALRGARKRRRLVQDHSRDSEIPKLDVTMLRQEHVFHFDVPVHHVLGMHVCHGQSELRSRLPNKLVVQGLHINFRPHITTSAPLQHQNLSILMDKGLNHRHNVWMVQRTQQLSLQLEVGVILGKLGHLQGKGLIRLHVGSAVANGEGAAAHKLVHQIRVQATLHQLVLRRRQVQRTKKESAQWMVFVARAGALVTWRGARSC